MLWEQLPEARNRAGLGERWEPHHIYSDIRRMPPPTMANIAGYWRFPQVGCCLRGGAAPFFFETEAPFAA